VQEGTYVTIAHAALAAAPLHDLAVNPLSPTSLLKTFGVAGVFAVLALAWLQSAIRAWTHDVSHWLVFAAFGVAVLLGVFAWTSFRRSRQIR